MKFIYCLSFVSLFFIGVNAQSQTIKDSLSKKPNIIFILTDDLGYGDIGVFFQNQRKENNDPSEPWTSTPNLDKMAAEGAILSQHYAAAPVCAPSRSSLLSGRSQGHTQVRDNQFDKALADNYTLGNVMKKAGYATAAIGKWGLQGSKKWSKNGDEWPARPSKRGFDYFYGYMRHVDGHEHYPKEGLYTGAKEVWYNQKEVSAGLDKCYTADLWTAQAKKWITEQVRDSSVNKPFFMYLAYDTPHAVLELPTQAYPKGGGLKGGLQWIGEAGHMINTASEKPDTYLHPDYAKAVYDDDKNPATADVPWPETYKRYATDVRRIDDAIGDLMQLFKDLGIDSNTLVVFSSDNGPSKESYLPKGYVPNAPDFFDSFGPFDGIKRDVLEGGERMPLIARWPGHIPEKRVSGTPSISYDWLATFTDAAGLPAPAVADGVSLLPSLTGIGEQVSGLVYSEYFQKGKTPGYEDFLPKHRNLRRNQMQLIRMGDKLGLRYDIKSQNDDFEIYDILKDTHQKDNLALHNDLSSLQKKMKEKVIHARRPNASAPRPYDSVPLPPSKVGALKEGFRWKSYAAAYPWLPKLDILSETDKGEVQNLKDMDYDKVSKYYLLTGYIKVPETGNYRFRFSTKEKALIRVHDAVLFDADYGYRPNSELVAEMILEKGAHPVKIYLRDRSGNTSPFQLQWKKQGSEQTWKSPTLYYTPERLK